MARSLGQKQTSHRISVSLTNEQYQHLVRIAEQKRVSLAWVVRDNLEKLIAANSNYDNEKIKSKSRMDSK